MHLIEKLCIKVRHGKWLGQSDGFWNIVRPLYDAMTGAVSRQGLGRNINGTDLVYLVPELRSVVETYEPEVWNHLMSRLHIDDQVVDVGAFIGLYTVALGKRLQKGGRVYGFEPTPKQFRQLQRHVEMNGVEAHAECIHAAVSNEAGEMYLTGDKGIQNHLTKESEPSASKVQVVTLDEYFEGKKIDILKVDVEGFEEPVLQGAEGILGDPERRPRIVYVEVHPYNWELCGTTSESLLGLLGKHSYVAQTIEGDPVNEITEYGEIVACLQTS